MNAPATGLAPAATPAPTRALAPIEQFRAVMNKPDNVASLKKNLPNHISVERFLRCAIMAADRNPRLLDTEVDRPSLYLAIQAAAQDGLLLDGREATIVTFNQSGGGKKAQYMPMVAGLLKKVRNSGELKTITAVCVYEKDEFNYHVDENGEHLAHKPDLLADNRGALKGVYALAQTKDGGIYMEVLSKSEVMKIKAVSRAKDSGPWKDWEAEMWEKSALRKLSKRLPMSTDILGAIFEREEEPEPMAEVAPVAAPSAGKGAGSRARAAVIEQPPAADGEQAPEPGSPL